LSRLWRWLIRFGFRLLYNELAFTYDWVSWGTSLGQWRAWQRCALRHLPRASPGSAEGSPGGAGGPRVLEMAHGTGDTLVDLAAAGYEPVGIDLSPHMGRLARRKLARHGLNLPLARGRAQALPFATGAIPAIVATFPTEYIMDPAALAEFHRVLRGPEPVSGRGPAPGSGEPAGRLVFVPTAAITGGGWLHRLAAWLFAVTGQSGPWPPQVEARYAAAGFRARVVVEQLEHSQVVVVVAEKVAR
jgi:ubiquinone/menaquinone biosynthesis C-methylase UbiE